MQGVQRLVAVCCCLLMVSTFVMVLPFLMVLTFLIVLTSLMLVIPAEDNPRASRNQKAGPDMAEDIQCSASGSPGCGTQDGRPYDHDAFASIPIKHVKKKALTGCTTTGDNLWLHAFAYWVHAAGLFACFGVFTHQPHCWPLCDILSDAVCCQATLQHDTAQRTEARGGSVCCSECS